MKRIPRIKFPQRHKQSPSSVSASQSTSTNGSTNQNLGSRSSSDVPAPPIDTAVGGKASLQPKRTPVSDKEIEAVLFNGNDEISPMNFSSSGGEPPTSWEVASDL